MTDNNFVAMEQNVCPVCGTLHTHNTGILINKRMQNIDPDNTVTGYGLCEADEKRDKEGYIALIAVNNGEETTLENADRTGEMAHVRRSVFKQLFNYVEPPKGPLAFVDPQVITMLKELQEKQEE